MTAAKKSGLKWGSAVTTWLLLRGGGQHQSRRQHQIQKDKEELSYHNLGGLNIAGSF